MKEDKKFKLGKKRCDEMKDKKYMRGYKFITGNRLSKKGDAGKWVKNRWKHHKRTISLCEGGFHACLKPIKALNYIYGDVFCIVEAKGNIVHEEGNKFVAESMRVVHFFTPEQTKEIFVEYAISCSWRVLNHYEKQFPNDAGARQAIQAAKRWLRNPCEETRQAARATSAAARAARAAWSARATSAAAWSAVSAAVSAAESAAWSTKEAVSAAESAAWSTKEAVRSAARAAESAAWSARATSATARAAEEKWQERRLQKIIDKKLKEECVKK